MENPFLNGLNQHGYAFQHRVLHEALSPPPGSSRRLPWQLLGVEIPVPGARIDFLLQNPVPPTGIRLLVAECKRVNPAYGTWCFTRSPHPQPEGRGNWNVTEVLLKEQLANDEYRLTTAVGWGHLARGYDIGFELRSTGRGDAHPISPDRDAIELACTQVLRGMNGLISELGVDSPYRRFAERQDHVAFIPVIFTTAKLLTADTDLTQTDLDSGELHVPLEAKAADWLFYQYAQSPQMKHALRCQDPEQGSFDELVVRSYVRSVAIVGPRGIHGFLANAAGHW